MAQSVTDLPIDDNLKAQDRDVALVKRIFDIREDKETVKAAVSEFKSALIVTFMFILFANPLTGKLLNSIDFLKDKFIVQFLLKVAVFFVAYYIMYKLKVI